MIYLCIIFCLVMVIIGKITEKKIINPVTVFFGLWEIIFVLYSLKLYNLNHASENTIFMMFIGLIFFAIGYYLWRLRCKYKTTTFKFGNFYFGIKNTDDFVLRYKLLYVFCIICIVFYLFQATTTISYLLAGNSLAFIREYAQETTVVETGILAAIRSLIVSPFVMALQPIVACDFWIGKRDKRLLILNIIILILRTIVDGSRSNLIYFVAFLFVVYVLKYGKLIKKQKKTHIDEGKKRKSKRVMKSLCIIGIFFIILTTMSRSGNNSIRYAYYYFTMEPYMFEYWSDRVDTAGIIGYGLGSTNGFSFPIMYVLHNFKILNNYPEFWHSINLMIGSTETEWQFITSGGTSANAYVSLFWYFYLDGKLAGIIIGSILYGIISANAYWTALKNMSTKAISIFIFILQGLFMSFVRFQFANMTYSLAFIIILIVYKRIQNKNKEMGSIY